MFLCLYRCCRHLYTDLPTKEGQIQTSRNGPAGSIRPVRITLTGLACLEETMATRSTYDETKLKELILYVASKCKNDPYFGAIKLNKILFYSDFSAYAKTGSPITGAEYGKYEHGPAPKRMKLIKRDLETSGDTYEYRVDITDIHHQRRLLACRKAREDLFTREELTIVDHIIETLWGKTATEVSQDSHRFAGWKHAKLGDAIPYTTVFLPEMPLPPSKNDLEWAKNRVEEYEKSKKAASA